MDVGKWPFPELLSKASILRHQSPKPFPPFFTILVLKSSSEIFVYFLDSLFPLSFSILKAIY